MATTSTTDTVTPPRPHAVASTNPAPRPGVMEKGSFAHAVCDRCAWRGPGRRSRSTAQHDGELHALAGCGI